MDYILIPWQYAAALVLAGGLIVWCVGFLIDELDELP